MLLGLYGSVREVSCVGGTSRPLRGINGSICQMRCGLLDQRVGSLKQERLEQWKETIAQKWGYMFGSRDKSLTRLLRYT